MRREIVRVRSFLPWSHFFPEDRKISFKPSVATESFVGSPMEIKELIEGICSVFLGKSLIHTIQCLWSVCNRWYWCLLCDSGIRFKIWALSPACSLLLRANSFSSEQFFPNLPGVFYSPPPHSPLLGPDGSLACTPTARSGLSWRFSNFFTEHPLPWGKKLAKSSCFFT